MLRNAVAPVALAVIASALMGGAVAHATPQEREEIILIEILMPGDAELELQGVKMPGAGALRTFQSPPLRLGNDYTYTVKATYQGKTVTRDLHLKHGMTNVLDLRADFAAAPARAVIPTKPIPVAGPAAKAAAPNGPPQDLAAIAKNAEGFVAAFHKGDARAVAAFWAPDGEYVDLAGRHLKGREAITAAFADYFATTKGAKVRIDSQSLRFLTPDVAVEEGTATVFPAAGGPPTRAHYTNVHVKKDGQWQLGSVKDAPVPPATNYEYLRGLEGALGEWEGANARGEVEHVTLGWSDLQNFVIGTFSTTHQGAALGTAHQWIGWDPTTKQIRSWTFDESGAFGEGTWTQDGNKWAVKTTVILPDGKKVTATLQLAPVDGETLTLLVKDRTVDGKPLPDGNEVKLKRVK